MPKIKPKEMKIIKLIFICILFFQFNACDDCPPNCPDPPEPSSLSNQEIQSALNNIVFSTGVPGVIVKVKSPRVDFLGASNNTSVPGLYQPLSINSKFRIGSITKLYVSTALLKWQELGLLLLNEIPIQNYVDNLPFLYRNSINLTMLLSHTSGLPDYLKRGTFILPTTLNGQIGGLWSNPNLTYSIASMFNAALTGPQFYPNTIFDYSNTNYLLAGIIWKAAYEHNHSLPIVPPNLHPYFKELFLDSLNLSNTIYQYDYNIPSNLAHGYEVDAFMPVGIRDVTYFHPSITNSAGAMITTANELYIFLYSLFNNEIINTQSLTKLLTPYSYATNYCNCYYGLGIFLDQSTLGNIYWHGGNLPGYSSDFHYYKDKDTYVIIFVNTNTNPANNNAITSIKNFLESNAHRW